MTDYLMPRDFKLAEGTGDWRIIGDGACTFFRTGSFAKGAAFADAIGRLEGVDAHAPDVDIRPDGVTVRLITYTDDWYGPSQRDVDLARRITALAGEHGLTADPSNVASLIVVIDAVDIPKVMPFWAALMGYEFRRDSMEEDLVDPNWRLPGIWFEQMDAPRDERNTIHLGVWVPEELAEARVQAALAAGGTLVTDRFAPSWWVLADPEGNEADVSSIAQRG